MTEAPNAVLLLLLCVLASVSSSIIKGVQGQTVVFQESFNNPAQTNLNNGTGNLAAALPWTNIAVINNITAQCNIQGSTMSRDPASGCNPGLCSLVCNFAGATPVMAASPSQPGGPLGMPNAGGNYYHMSSKWGANSNPQCLNSHYWINDGQCMSGSIINSESRTAFDTRSFSSCTIEFWWLGLMHPQHVGSIWYTSNGGTTWTKIVDALTGASTWTKKTQNIDDVAGHASVRLAYRLEALAQVAANDPPLSLDEITITCTSPAAGTTTTSSTAATISTIAATTTVGSTATSSATSTLTTGQLSPTTGQQTSTTGQPSPTTGQQTSAAPVGEDSQADDEEPAGFPDWLLYFLIAIGVCCLCVAFIVVFWFVRRDRGNHSDSTSVEAARKAPEYTPLPAAVSNGSPGSPGPHESVGTPDTPLPAGSPGDHYSVMSAESPAGAQTPNFQGHYTGIGVDLSMSNQTPSKSRKRFGEESSTEISYSELTMMEDIGRGSFGVVARAKWRATEVAVKRMESGNGAAFVAEAELMQGVRPHPNVLLYLGVCHSPMAIIVEYMPKGSLYDFLHNASNTILDDRKIAFCHGIAKGMLHLTQEGIAHRDLAARNVLLASDFTPKIADFGMARVLLEHTESNMTDANVAPLKWLAPEAILHRVYNEKTDVWAYGIVCIEVVTREDPYPGMDPIQVAAQIGQEEGKPEVPAKSPRAIADAITRCLKFNPTMRATFADLCKVFG